MGKEMIKKREDGRDGELFRLKRYPIPSFCSVLFSLRNRACEHDTASRDCSERNDIGMPLRSTVNQNVGYMVRQKTPKGSSDRRSLSPLLLLTNILVPEQRPRSCYFMIHDWSRVSQLLELVRGHIMERIVDCFALEVFELRYPVADVISIGITFLRLSLSVEDSL